MKLAIIDFSAVLGMDAFEAHVAQPAGAEWQRLEVDGLSAIFDIRWLRVTSAQHQPLPFEDAEQGIVIVGPGSTPRLAQLIPQIAGMGLRACKVFFVPNAIVERDWFAHFVAGREGAWELLTLPNSDPKALWFIILAELERLALQAGIDGRDSQSDKETQDMSSNLKQSIDAAMNIEGALAAALVDYRSGMCLAKSVSTLNLDLAAAGNTEVVRAKLKTVESLGLRRGIEDILITLTDQYHLIRLVPNAQGLFLYLVLDKNKGNLALARYKLGDIEKGLRV